MKTIVQFLFCGCALILVNFPVGAQETFKLNESNIELITNGPAKTVTAIALTPEVFSENAEIIWSGHAGFVSISQVLSADRKSIVATLKPLQVTNSRIITATLGSTSVQIKLRVDPEVSATTLALSELSAQEKLSGVTLTKGGFKRVSLNQKDASTIPENALSATSDSQNTASASINDNRLIIEAEDEGSTVVRLKAYGKEILPIKVIVTAGVDLNKYRNKTHSLKKGAELALSEIFGDDLAKLEISPTQHPNVAVLSTDKTKITGVNVDITSFTVALKDDPTQKATINISVEANPQKIVYTGLGSRALLVGERLPVMANVEGDGEVVRKATIKLETSDPTCISVVSKPDNNFTVTGERSGCGALLTFSTKIPGVTIPDTTVDLTTNIVGGFRYLKIRLDMMDNQTAKDLFGKKAVDEYFIAKVRLFNAIREGDRDFGNSILVYSESLAVKVAVEWRTEGREWSTLTEKVAKDKWFPNGLTNDEKEFEEQDKRVRKQRCHIIEQQDMFVPYRPLTFEMVLNTQERRDSRSTRSRILRGVNAVSSLGSFITSIAVPGPGSDLPLGLDKFKNLFIPSFEKLFPSLNEVQRQNITSMVMRPLEEIPFGSDITRVLFFPKRKISGVLLNQPGEKKTELRISAISVADACAEAGIIKKLPQTP